MTSRRVRVLIASVSFVLVVTGCSGDDGPGEEVGADEEHPFGPNVPRATEHDGLVQLRPAPWNSALIESGHLYIDFLTGPDRCDAFAEVQHVWDGETLVITLFLGNEPGACTGAIPGMGFPAFVEVPLDRDPPALDDMRDGTD